MSNAIREMSWPDWSKLKFSANQAEVINCKSDRILVKAGRFYGKDHLLLFLALLKAFELFALRQNDPEWDRIGETVIVMVLAPTETNAADLWKRIIAMLPPIPGVAINGKPNIHIKHDARIIEIFGGDITICFETTTQAENLRGRACDILVVTECAFHTKKALVDVVFPCCIRSGYAGIVYLNSSPEGAGAWYDQECLDLSRGKGLFHDLGFRYFTGSLFDNPKTTDSEIQALKAIKKANPYTAQREWLGWLNVPKISNMLLGAGQSLAFDAALIKSVKLTTPVNTSGPYYIGIDLAGKGKDHLGVCVLDHNGVIVHLERHASTSLGDIIRIITRLNTTWRPLAITYDQNMGILRGSSKDDGVLSVVPLKPLNMTNLLKCQLVEKLQHHLISKSIRIPDPEFYYRYIEPSSKYMRQNLWILDKEIHEYIRFDLRQERHYKGRVEETNSVTYHKPHHDEASDDLLDALFYAASNITVPYQVRTLEEYDASKPQPQPKPGGLLGGGGGLFSGKGSGLFGR